MYLWYTKHVWLHCTLFIKSASARKSGYALNCRTRGAFASACLSTWSKSNFGWRAFRHCTDFRLIGIIGQDFCLWLCKHNMPAMVHLSEVSICNSSNRPDITVRIVNTYNWVQTITFQGNPWDFKLHFLNFFHIVCECDHLIWSEVLVYNIMKHHFIHQNILYKTNTTYITFGA